MIMMGKQMLYYIDQILKQASVKMDQTFGGLGIISVRVFHQLLPVAETTMYEVDGYALYLLYDAI